MVDFSFVELDLLAIHSGAALPYPLDVPQAWEDRAARDRLFNTTATGLRQRGLADEHGPAGLAASLVAALAHRQGTVDLVFRRGSSAPVAMVALINGTSAIVCRQVLDHYPSGTVRVTEVDMVDVIEALVGEVPLVPPAKSPPVRIPAAAVHAGRELVLAGSPQASSRIGDLVREHGGDQYQLDTLVSLLPSVSGQGQAGACRTNEHRRDVRVGFELSWLDGPHGRLRVVDGDGEHGWMSVNPLRDVDLRTTVGELVELART